MNYEFYKNKFDRELNRRNYLDSAINNPVAGITVIVAILSYILKNHNFKNWNCLNYLLISLIAINAITLLVSLYYIFLSNNNLFKGFNYLNFGLLSEYKKTEKIIKEKNKQSKKDKKINFKEMIIEKIILYSDNHTIINDKRAEDLYMSRKYVIISFIISIIILIIVTIKKI